VVGPAHPRIHAGGVLDNATEKPEQIAQTIHERYGMWTHSLTRVPQPDECPFGPPAGGARHVERGGPRVASG
jgi:hypothetical protein